MNKSRIISITFLVLFHIMLVSAFCGYDETMEIYRVAVEEKYRFFSFGDAMFII